MVAVAILGASAVGAAATAYSAQTAAGAQTAAAGQAANTALSMYNQTNQNLSPYRNIGQTAATDLTNRLGELTSPITMSQADVEATPGYAFNSTQGLKAVQNSAAARGLGNSGAALKGAATFAVGLADNTYQNQFNNAVTNQTNAFNRLQGLVNTGENAAAQTGSAGTAAANTAASAQTQAGTAQAAAANATGSAVSNFANNAAGYAAYSGLYGNTNGNNPAVAGATNVVGNNGNTPVPTFPA